MDNKYYNIILGLMLLLAGFYTRVLPHEPNMTAVTAVAFIGSLYIGKRWGFILALSVMAASDVFIGFYEWKIMASVYASLAIIGLLSALAGKYRSIFSIGFSLLGSSVLFFLITNAAVWFYSPWYEKNFAGLMYSYELGLPFFRNMLTGDIVYFAGLVLAIEAVRAISLVWKRPAFAA